MRDLLEARIDAVRNFCESQIRHDGGDYGLTDRAWACQGVLNILDGKIDDQLGVSWPTLMDIPSTVAVVYDNQGRKWERDGWDWVTYGSYIQRWSTAVTDLSGWGPFKAEAS